MTQKCSKKSVALCMLFCFSFAVFAQTPLPETDKLLKDLSVTVTQSAILKKRVDKAKTAVTKTINAIKKAEKVSKTISKVNTVLKTTKDAMLALQAIPQIRTFVHEAEEIVSKIQDPVDTVDKKAKSFVKKLQPLKKRLTQLQKALKAADKGLAEINKVATKAQPPIKKTANCINALKAGKIKKKLSQAIEGFSGTAEHPVKDLNEVLLTINRDIDKINSYVNKFVDAVKHFDPLAKVLNKIWSKINIFSPVFKEINKILNYKIKVPYSFKIKVKIPFKVKVKVKVRFKVRFKVKIRTWKVWKWHVSWKWKWKWKWKWSWKWKHSFKWGFKVKMKYFSFSINQIMKGINTGIGFVNKKLFSLAHKLIDPILKKLHIKLPSLPGISTLLKKLNFAHNFFDNFKVELEHIAHYFSEIINKLRDFKNRITSFAVRCGA